MTVYRKFSDILKSENFPPPPPNPPKAPNLVAVTGARLDGLGGLGGRHRFVLILSFDQGSNSRAPVMGPAPKRRGAASRQVLSQPAV